MKSPTSSSSREDADSSFNSAARSPGPFSGFALKGSSRSQRGSALPDWDSCDDLNATCSEDSVLARGENSGRLNHHTNDGFKREAMADNLVDENSIPGPAKEGTGLTSAQIHNISQKFREILHLKNRGMQELPVSENLMLMNSLDTTSAQSLSSLINAIFSDKHPEEVPALMEFMLRKVMAEFECRLVTQGQQIVRLKKQLTEHAARKDRLASRARVLETLVAGSGEEYKIISGQLQKMKAEKLRAYEEKKGIEEEGLKLLSERDETLKMVDSLRKELELNRCIDQEQRRQLELQKEDLELELRGKLKDMEVLLENSRKELEEMETTTAHEIQFLKEREGRYQAFIELYLQSFEDLKKTFLATRQEVICMQGHWSEEVEALGVQLHGLVNAASSYHKVIAENRQLYNEVQDLKGNIRVYCRVRPFLPTQTGGESTVDFIGENGDIMIVNRGKPGKEAHKMFSFNKAYGPSATQEEVFLDTRPLIRSVLDGYNVCIFAYGQTGSGKTHTMSGPKIMSPVDWGVNYRALNDLFQISLKREDVMKYEISVQMVEIYNEQVRDLLASEGQNKRLEIRNNSQTNGLNVPDASLVPVGSTEDVLELMKIGQKNRAVGATALNDRSSRSHSVLTVHVQGTDLVSGNSLRGCLHLVDLAGSERVDKSEATGDRLKEAQHINKSLSALGDVIAALAQKNPHVPYRNSKLTQLLQDSLGGQAKTLMFVHISPDVESYGETTSTLKFAERVASIELGAARSNRESKDVRELKEQVALLKDTLARKDAEIERLQNMKESRHTIPETLSTLERPKAKVPTVSTKKSTGEPRSRRQVVEGLTNSKKHLAAGSASNLSQDSQSASAESSPRNLKVFHPSHEDEKEKPGKSKLSQKPRSQQNKMASNEQTLASQAMQPKQKVMRNITEMEAGLEGWKERVHSSSDSSLTGTASLEDPPYAWDTNGDSMRNKRDTQGLFLSGISSGYDASEENYELDSQGLSGNQLGNPPIVSESDFVPKYMLEPDRDMDANVVGYEVMEGDPDERPNELSDGDISLVETEASQLSTLDNADFNERKGHEKASCDENRKQPQLPPLPHPVPRNELKYLRGQPQTRLRRHSASTAATPVIMKTSYIKRQSSLGVRHNAEVGSSSSKSELKEGNNGKSDGSRQEEKGGIVSDGPLATTQKLPLFLRINKKPPIKFPALDSWSVSSSDGFELPTTNLVQPRASLSAQTFSAPKSSSKRWV